MALPTKLIIVVTIIAIVSISSFVYYLQLQQHQSLLLCSADAYVGEVNSLAQNFTARSGIRTALRSAGSFAMAREISQGLPCDVFIPVSIAAVHKEYLGNQTPGWAIAIASDQMVIAYSNSTLTNTDAVRVINYYREAATENTTDKWKQFFLELVSGAVKVGIADPASDPAGLRGWLVLEAAGYRYAGNESLFVSNIIRNKGNVTASHAANLIAPLQTGNIQFLFIYRSAAFSQRLKFMALEDQINLGNKNYVDYYSRFSYQLPTGVQKGVPILLYITVPLNSRNKDIAIEFVSFTIKNSIGLSNFGLVPLLPPLLYNSTSPPIQIKQLINEGDLGYGGWL